jgi:hypothetical protein
MAKVSFKDFTPVDYMPGEDELIKRQAKKRKMDTPTGNTGESVEPTDEALTMAQRRKKARTMRKYQARIKVGAKKAKAKIASAKVLAKRAQKAARRAMAKKLTQGIAKRDLTPSRKKEIEARLDKMKPRVNRLAKKLLPQLRRAEMGKKRS